MTMRLPFVTLTAAVTFVTVTALALRSLPAAAAIPPDETPPAAADPPPDLLNEPPVVRHTGAPAAPAARPQVKEKALIGNPLWAIPLKQLLATRDRPIFSPSRRPPPAVAAPAATVAPKPAIVIQEPERPQLSLIGTIVGKDATIGIFLDGTTRKAILLKLGQSHNGWTLKSVLGNAAMLERFQQSAIITMRTPENPHGAPSGSAPPLQLPGNGPAPASAPNSEAPVATTGAGRQLFGQSPFAATPVSDRASAFGATPLFGRTNR